MLEAFVDDADADLRRMGNRRAGVRATVSSHSSTVDTSMEWTMDL